jgi:hypothetical protein
MKHPTSRFLPAAVAASLLLATSASAGGIATSIAGAGAHAQASAAVSVEQRVRAELRAVMTDLIESGAFGAGSPQGISLDVAAPAERVSNLGLLLDSGHGGADGLPVLGVTPGSAAERMGLRAGDRLLALNDVALTGPDAAASLRRTVDGLPDGSPLRFDLRRDGRPGHASGALASVYLPPMRLVVGDGVASASAAQGAAPTAAVAIAGCGRISDFDVAPRQQQLHAAKIISIDGVTPGPSGARSYRVGAGRHAVKVSEQIESRYLSFNDRQRNSGVSSDRYKTLEVDVEPDTTVLIAAHLDEDRRDQWQHGAYWEPVAWKQVAEPCR